MTSASADSLRLRDIATAAFHDYALPAIRSELPQVETLITVLITSSVAYGTADSHSDLDVFIVFRTERDYRLYADALAKLIDGLRLDDVYGNVCDKGVRFELESLPRSDLSQLYHHPKRAAQWRQQTEWLLRWFIDSVPIHDPAGVHERLSRVAGQWPAAIRQERQLAAQTRVVTWTSRALLALDENGVTFPALRASCHAATAGLDIAYLAADQYAPHPKWRHTQAAGLLTGHHAAEAALAAVDHLATALASPQDEPASLAETLAGHRATQAPNPHEPAIDWDGCLAQHADAFTDGPTRVWVARERAPSQAFHAAARTAAGEGAHVYLAEEMGADHLRSGERSYDRNLRVSDGLRWLAGQALTRQDSVIQRRRWLYLNFVIWRKLRVIPKAQKRGQPLTRLWYQLQAVEHLVEAWARLHGTYSPPVGNWDARTLSFLEQRQIDMLTTPQAAGALRDTEAFLTWAWHEFAGIQRQLVTRGLVPHTAVDDPLATQWDIQYWKYENLFA
ncbi:nucleotidyltransferase domain-containing protein [Streptomyces sp. TP-A0356]|uniref:nucleotidyltransferase domain-containing protein n=1 Tax=Streptomyces sp. TP-A0356 TaxID=1359208 RepID=UPI0006E4556A|nr:nucleotidyltransferase domain-containing protein [Streptomyces sp. TP-A0356]